MKRLTHYTVLAVGLGVALQTVGVDLGALFAAGAVFAVGIGFGGPSRPPSPGWTMPATSGDRWCR